MFLHKMKKQIILGLVMMVLLVGSVSGLGVVPAAKLINYKPGVEVREQVEIHNTEHKELTVALYPSGEFSEFVEIDEDFVSFEASEEKKTVGLTITLPEGVDPGLNIVEVTVLELPSNFGKEGAIIIDEEGVKVITLGDESRSMISSTVALVSQFRFNVPYPGTFAKGKLYISDAQVNDTATFTVSLFNAGKDEITDAYAIIKVLGPTNEEIASIDTNKISLESKHEGKLVANWKANVHAGNYHARAIVFFNNEQIVLEENFMVGNLFIDILGINVDKFRLGEIVKLDVLLENKWNQPVDDIYADLSVLDKNGLDVSKFKTGDVSLQPYARGTISGYWDTSGVVVGEYDIHVKLNYADKSSEKLFETVVGPNNIEVKDSGLLAGQVTGVEGEGSSMSLLFVLVFVLIIFNVGVFIYLRRMKKK
jgi:hypothetical protein